MTSGLRWGFILVGLALLFGSFIGWGTLGLEWFFRGVSAASIERYDLRPFIFVSPTVQVWFARIVPRGWALVGIAGVLFFLKGCFRPVAGRIAIGGLVVTCLLALVLMVASGPVFLHSGAVPVASLQGFERLARVSFPPGTELVEARYEGGMDPSYAAMVTMPPAAVEGFARSAIKSKMTGQGGKPLPLRLSRTQRLEVHVPQLTGFADWRPETARKFLSASTGGVSGDATNPSIEVFADQDDQNRSIVYLTIEYM
jgi:hypothetical protein